LLNKKTGYFFKRKIKAIVQAEQQKHTTAKTVIGLELEMIIARKCIFIENVVANHLHLN